MQNPITYLGTLLGKPQQELLPNEREHSMILTSGLDHGVGHSLPCSVLRGTSSTWAAWRWESP